MSCIALARNPGGPLLPPLEGLQALVPQIAFRLGRRPSGTEWRPGVDEATLRLQPEERRWVPEYVPILLAD